MSLNIFSLSFGSRYGVTLLSSCLSVMRLSVDMRLTQTSVTPFNDNTVVMHAIVEVVGESVLQTIQKVLVLLLFGGPATHILTLVMEIRCLICVNWIACA